jgi:hypothetical protein
MVHHINLSKVTPNATSEVRRIGHMIQPPFMKYITTMLSGIVFYDGFLARWECEDPARVGSPLTLFSNSDAKHG